MQAQTLRVSLALSNMRIQLTLGLQGDTLDEVIWAV